ncbi:MAG: hypothetical protein E6K53_12990 [Gammaproteobacteria bacterium]|nr:MAG: hypothetical protein E6K53_12990 [Gammaproteobacteria bacterium]
MDNPPAVGVDFVKNCEAIDDEGTIVNVASGFVIRRPRRHEDTYFPAFDLPEPDEAMLEHLGAMHPAEGDGPVVIDRVVALGGVCPRHETAGANSETPIGLRELIRPIVCGRHYASFLDRLNLQKASPSKSVW